MVLALNSHDELLSLAEHLLGVVTHQPKVELGGWDWDYLAKTIRTVIDTAKGVTP